MPVESSIHIIIKYTQNKFRQLGSSLSCSRACSAGKKIVLTATPHERVIQRYT